MGPRTLAAMRVAAASGGRIRKRRCTEYAERASGSKISFMRQGPDPPAGGSGPCPLLRRGRAIAGARLRLDGRERRWIAGVDAFGMTETTGAVPRAAIGIGGDVEDDVVGTRRIAGHSPDTRQGT